MAEQDEILAGLPPFFPTDPESGNHDLVVPIAGRTADISDSVQQLQAALRVQHANSIEQLQKHAALIDLPPEEGESVEHYRARIIAEFQLVTAEGTIDDVLNGASVILNANKTNFTYSERGSPNGTATLGVPGAAIEATPLDGPELAGILERLLASSYTLRANIKGTFTYVAPEDYESGSMEASWGYDGLDSNGDPKDTGGTYAGRLN